MTNPTQTAIIMTEMKRAGLSERHIDFRPRFSSNEEWSNVYNRTKIKIPDGILVCLCGSRGCGKTQMASCFVGYTLFTLKREALYVKTLDLFVEIREGMAESGESGAIKKYCSPKLLVIDALEVRKSTDFEKQCLDHIIDRRYESINSTVLITNETPEEFRKEFSDSILSRMKETGGIIQFNWGSFR